MAQAVELNGKKILVTFLMHLGDLTLTTPFIHALRKAAPDAHITFLADEKLKDVVLRNPYLDEVITIDKKGKDNSLLALMACARRLSKMDFDVLINLHPNERCSFIDAFTKVKLRCGTTHTMFKPLWDVFTPLNRKIHAADMYLDVLTQLGVQKLEHNGLEIFPSEEYKQHADEFWREHGVFASDKLVGFNIGSAVVTKRWAPERFAKVADILAEKGYKPVFFGGTMDEEMVQEYWRAGGGNASLQPDYHQRQRPDARSNQPEGAYRSDVRSVQSEAVRPLYQGCNYCDSVAALPWLCRWHEA